jgi:hypothetical protein
VRAKLSLAVLALLGTRGLVAQEHAAHRSAEPGWHTVVEGTVFLQYVRAFGTRGAYQFGSVNRVMIQRAGPLGGGVLALRAMASAEPVTLTDRGAPQLLQVSFPSDGATITDRVHPSPWLMELAGAYEHGALSLYAAAIGEPALGPPAYAHRPSAFANPAVPLGHHSQDVTHSSFGVVTAGIARGAVRVEASAFNDRQPDEPTTVFSYRGARLDSYAGRLRVAWGSGSSLYGFYGYLPAAGSGHHHGSLHRVGAAIVHNAAPWFLTIVYSANDPVGRERPAGSALVEAQRRWKDEHVLFARAEYVQRTDEELSLIGSVNERQDVGAVQVGYARGIRTVETSRLRVGMYGLLSIVPPQLRPFYGSRIPFTVAAFGHLSFES